MHTVRLASRNIILSFMCFIGDCVSAAEVGAPGAAGEGFDGATTPLELFALEARWVMGLVPCPQAFC
jgi:hypothetical protein